MRMTASWCNPHGPTEYKVVARSPRPTTSSPWSNYFCHGTRRSAFRGVDRYVYERVRDFLARRHKVAGRGTRRFSCEVVRRPEDQSSPAWKGDRTQGGKSDVRLCRLLPDHHEPSACPHSRLRHCNRGRARSQDRRFGPHSVDLLSRSRWQPDRGFDLRYVMAHAAAEPALHWRHTGQETGRDRRAEEGCRDRRPRMSCRIRDEA